MRRRGAKTQRKKEGWVFRGFLYLLLFGFVTACEAEVPTPPPVITPTAPPSTLRIGLTSSASEFMSLTAAPFEAAYPQTAVQFTTANNLTLLTDLEAGQFDAIIVHHLPPATEFWFNPVALDGLAIIVHPDNPISELSTADIQAIFNGRITNWSSLGGQDLLIEVNSREQGAGSRILFSEQIMLEQRVSITAQIVTNNNQMIEAVASNPAAVGYSMMGTVGDNVSALAVEHIVPTPLTTADQSYPLTTPLYFVSSAEPTGNLRTFLAWLQSEAGQNVLGEKYGRVR